MFPSPDDSLRRYVSRLEGRLAQVEAELRGLRSERRARVSIRLPPIRVKRYSFDTSGVSLGVNQAFYDVITNSAQPSDAVWPHPGWEQVEVSSGVFAATCRVAGWYRFDADYWAHYNTWSTFVEHKIYGGIDVGDTSSPDYSDMRILSWFDSGVALAQRTFRAYWSDTLNCAEGDRLMFVHLVSGEIPDGGLEARISVSERLPI